MGNSPYWWDSYGPFDPDPDDQDFPNAGQVVQHYRLLKKWTPAQLGEAMNKTARWVQAMEHDNTVPEAISRRKALADMLDIPKVLLGVATVDHLVTPQAAISSIQPTKVDTATLNQYRQSLRLYWELFYTSTTYNMTEEITRSVRNLRKLSSETTGYQNSQVLDILCRYEQLAAHILRDQGDYNSAMIYANRAVKMARSIEDNELIASALLRRSFVSSDSGSMTNAITDLDAALPFAKHARPPLKGFISQVTGHKHASLTQSSTEATLALNLLDQAGTILHRGNLEDDESFVRFNTGWYHQERAGALLVLHRSEDALDELDKAERYLGPMQPRRLVQINIHRAEAYINQGELTVATGIAEEALTVALAIKSDFMVDQIIKLYERLKKSKNGNSPQVARLGYLLTSKN